MIEYLGGVLGVALKEHGQLIIRLADEVFSVSSTDGTYHREFPVSTVATKGKLVPARSRRQCGRAS